jgi:hypothetical protein
MSWQSPQSCSIKCVRISVYNVIEKRVLLVSPHSWSKPIEQRGNFRSEIHEL